MLLELRKKRGWSVYDLEECADVSRSTLSRIERAEDSPTMTVLVKVCLAYGCSVSHLMAEVEARQPVPECPATSVPLSQ
ncbi:helix-turn-helix domain-containing protein [Streptomyces xylophagus]|uniref:helix-turn-helix domain-containing protein n=1 Tax=Streptomyces xylophagus TaxID=285514 RepID=UPI00068FD705|nr:helix-turn-helix transcriptional regulator [Streptomyces xylophagus]